VKLHELDTSYADARGTQDFHAIQARPLPHAVAAEQPDDLHGDLPLAHSLRALFALFGDQQNGELSKS
jgi:hypothetical protein